MQFYGNIIYQDEKYTMTDQWFMYRTQEVNDGNAYRISNLLGGEETFNKKYKGDFQLWIKDVRNREYKTMESYRRQAAELLSKADYMKKMNGF